VVEGNGNLHVVIDGIICAGTEQHHLHKKKNLKNKKKEAPVRLAMALYMSELNLVTLKWKFKKVV